MELAWFKQTNQQQGNEYAEKGYKATLFHALKVDTSLLQSRPELRFYTTYIRAQDNGISQFRFADRKRPTDHWRASGKSGGKGEKKLRRVLRRKMPVHCQIQKGAEAVTTLCNGIFQ